MKSDRKPPLAKSPMRVRARRSLKPTITTTPLRTPIGSVAKTQMKISNIKSQCNTISSQLRDLQKMVQDELGSLSSNVTPFDNHNKSNAINLGLFERGRFYDVYSARRDERLRKKQIETGEINEPKTAYNLRVKVESTKKKKVDNLKKPMAVTCTVDRSQRSRYALRSLAKKPPLPVPMTLEGKTSRKPAASRASRK